MMRLSHQDYERLLQTICQLHDIDSAQAFRAEAPKLLLQLVPGDYLVFSDHQMDASSKRVRLVDYFESEPRLTDEGIVLGERHVFSHPFTKYFLGGGAPTALKQTDFLSLSEFSRSVWGFVQSRALRVERMIGLPVTPGKGNVAAISIGRGRTRDFDERDRLVLNLLRRHYDQACRRLRLLQTFLGPDAQPLAAYALSPREREVARWLAEGKSNPEIGVILGASPRTIDKHVQNILRKLGVEHRSTAAVLIARSLQLERFHRIFSAPTCRDGKADVLQDTAPPPESRLRASPSCGQPGVC